MTDITVHGAITQDNFALWDALFPRTVTESSAANTCYHCDAPVDPDKWPFDPARTRVVYCPACLKEMEHERQPSEVS
jgi:hypothetical protein